MSYSLFEDETTPLVRVLVMGLLHPVELTEAILQHPLLDGEARQKLPEMASRYTDSRELAQELLRRDWLTAYQVNQLFLGRARHLVLGPYVLMERLGEGGMGQVFKACQRSLNRIVALKVIRKELLKNARVVKRFAREMQAIGQLRHANIVHAYDAGQVDEACFIAMEFIDGIDLSRLVKQSGPLPVVQACDFIRQAALGLQHAHERGLVHRDIKPANLFLTRTAAQKSSTSLPRPAPPANNRSSGVIPRPNPADTPWGLVKILDLGLARWTDCENERTHLTQIGTLMGTPDFIAPEQALNSSGCDIRADIYSLGCTLYFLLTGRPPFAEGTLTEKLIRHQMEVPEPAVNVRRRRLLDPDWVAMHGKPAQEALDVSGPVDAILRNMLAKNPGDRYPTPGELAQHLAQVVNGTRERKKTRPMPRPNLAPPARVTIPKSPEPQKTPQKLPTVEPAPLIVMLPSPRRSRRKWAILGLVAALACVVAIAAAQSGGSRPQASTSTPGERKMEHPSPSPNISQK